MTKPVTEKPGLSKMFTIFIVVSTLALLIAALWNWQALKWHELVWLAAFVVMLIIRTPHAARNRKNAIASDENNAMETVMLIAMLLTSALLPLYHLSESGYPLDFADYVLPDWAMVIGAVLTVPFLWLFWRSHEDLGRNWSPGLEMLDDHTLVTSGVYKHMRHPMYSSIWLLALAQPLLIHNWLAGFAIIPSFLLMHVVRIPREEAMMRKQFGAAYDDYMKRTGRIWPKLS